MKKALCIITIITIALSMSGCNRLFTSYQESRLSDATQQPSDMERVTTILPNNETIVNILEQPVSILVAMYCLDFTYTQFSASNDGISSYLYNYANIYQTPKMQNQIISFTHDEIDQALNLAFGNRFSSNDINVDDADDYQARPSYSDGVFSFTYGEAVCSRLTFTSSLDETTYIYEYIFESVAYDMYESGSVTVTIEASSNNPFGFSIKSLQVSPSETSGADMSTQDTDNLDLAGAIANLPQSDAINIIWDLLDGYWNTEDNFFTVFMRNEGLPSIQIGKWESSGGLGFGELIDIQSIGAYEISMTVCYPATEASEVSDAREESTAIISVDMKDFERDGTFNIELVNHDGISRWYTFLYGGKTGEEAYENFLNSIPAIG
jgi:hypothetical protein